jgi:aspartate/methionine/tyrosine aminotransferase
MFISDMEGPGTTAAAEAARIRKVSGQRVIPLRGHSTLDGQPAQHIREAAAEAAMQGGTSPPSGLPELREAIAEKLHLENGIAVDPEREILVTTGAKEAIFLVMASLLSPGDEVLLHSPNYVFDGAVRLCGAVPVYVPATLAEGYGLPLEGVNPGLRTRILVLCNPVNPTGHLPTREEVLAFGRFAERHGLILLSDESFEKYVYDGRSICSPAAFPEFRSRTVTVHSFSKSYSLTRYRVGYIAGPEPLIEVCRRLHEWICIQMNPISQKAAWAALTGPQEWLAGLRAVWQRSRDHFVELIAGLPELPFAPIEATGSAFVDVSVFKRPCREVSRFLLNQYAIPSVPGEVFHAPGFLRIPFGGEPEARFQLIEALGEALKKKETSDRVAI